MGTRDQLEAVFLSAGSHFNGPPPPPHTHSAAVSAAYRERFRHRIPAHSSHMSGIRVISDERVT